MKNIRMFYLKISLVVKFPVYLNRYVFVTTTAHFIFWIFSFTFFLSFFFFFSLTTQHFHVYDLLGSVVGYHVSHLQ